MHHENSIRNMLRRMRNAGITTAGLRRGTGAGPVEHGRCALCGWTGTFRPSRTNLTPDADYRCRRCSAPRRFRDEAASILSATGTASPSLRKLVRSAGFNEVALYHIGISGPVRSVLRRLPRYVESTFDEPAGPRFEPTRRSYQDLQQLGYADDSFDLVVSSHVMEHVPDPGRAFREIHRVLRPGGLYVFGVPFSPERPTRARAELRPGGVVHLEEPRHHDSPQGGALVFTDFGRDLPTLLSEWGFDAQIDRHEPRLPRYQNAVVIAARR